MPLAGSRAPSMHKLVCFPAPRQGRQIAAAHDHRPIRRSARTSLPAGSPLETARGGRRAMNVCAR